MVIWRMGGIARKQALWAITARGGQLPEYFYAWSAADATAETLANFPSRGTDTLWATEAQEVAGAIASSFKQSVQNRYETELGAWTFRLGEISEERQQLRRAVEAARAEVVEAEARYDRFAARREPEMWNDFGWEEYRMRQSEAEGRLGYATELLLEAKREEEVRGRCLAAREKEILAQKPLPVWDVSQVRIVAAPRRYGHRYGILMVGIPPSARQVPCTYSSDEVDEETGLVPLDLVTARHPRDEYQPEVMLERWTAAVARASDPNRKLNRYDRCYGMGPDRPLAWLRNYEPEILAWAEMHGHLAALRTPVAA